MPRYELIKIEQLVEPEIPARGAMDEQKLNELRDSIVEIGYIHPLAVVLVPSGGDGTDAPGKQRRKALAKTSPARYEIVDGHRRYLCGKMLSHKVLPCLIFDDPDNAREAIKLHTALFREDLSTAEEAAFIADLINRYDYTEEQLCRALRQKPSWINERIAVMRGNKAVFDALRDRKITLAVAKQLNRVKDESQCSYFLQLVIEGGATALTVGQWVAQWLTQKDAQASASTPGQPLTVLDPQPVKGPECFFCKREDEAYNLENVWIHPWERKMIEAQLERASPPAPGEVDARGPAN